MLKDFKQFLLRGNLVDLAVAVVIGAAFGAVVTALVADFITPLIAAIFGKQSFADLSFTINHSTFHYGAFLNALLSFVIIAFVVFFFVITPTTHLMRRMGAMPEEEPAKKPCPECLTEVPEEARRCPACTSVLVPEAA